MHVPESMLVYYMSQCHLLLVVLGKSVPLFLLILIEALDAAKRCVIYFSLLKVEQHSAHT